MGRSKAKGDVMFKIFLVIWFFFCPVCEEHWTQEGEGYDDIHVQAYIDKCPECSNAVWNYKTEIEKK